MIVEENTLDNNLKLCECGCGKPVTIYYGKPRRFINGHFWMGKKRLHMTGENHFNWKGGRDKHGDYWRLRLPDYFSSDKWGYVYEHIYFYQEFNKCCLLPWGVVHHIEPVTKDYCNNMPWNLEGMINREHNRIHMIGNKNAKKDHSNTRCSDPECKHPDKTCISKKKYPIWFSDNNGGFLCHTCYHRHVGRKIIKKKRSSLRRQ